MLQVGFKHHLCKFYYVTDGIGANQSSGDKLDDPKVLYRESQATVALRKIAKPEDVARSIVWLSSEKWSGHISGQCISIDGGMEGRVIYSYDECQN